MASSETEALASLAGFRNRLLLVLGLTFVGAVAFSYFARRAWAIVRAETPRRQAEEALRVAERQLRLILDTVPAMIWQKDLSGRYLMANKAVCRTVGLTQDELRGKTDHDLFPAEIADQYVHSDRVVLDSGTPLVGFEVAHRKPSGELGWSLTDKVPFHDAWGRIAGTIGFALDISERKRAEEALVLAKRRAEENEAQLRAVSDNIPNGMVYQIDTGADGKDRRYTYISAGVEALHGVRAEEVLTDPMTIYRQVVEEDRPLLAEREASALARLVPFSAELRLRMPNGALRSRLFVSVPRRLADGRLVWDGVELDITELRQLEREKEELRTRLW